MEYFRCKGAVSSSRMYPHDTMLSREEWERTFSGGIEKLIDKGTLHRVPPDEVANVKRACGVTPENEDGRAKAVEENRRNYDALIDKANNIPSRLAKLFLDGLGNWKVIEEALVSEMRAQPSSVNPPNNWIEATQRGLKIDQLRAELNVIQMHLRKLLQPIKVAVVKLDGFTATKLQQFVATMGKSNQQPNDAWLPAKLDAEMLVHKLEDYEEMERIRAAEAASKKGLRGLRKQFNQAIVDEGVSGFARFFWFTIGAVTVSGLYALWYFILSKSFQ